MMKEILHTIRNALEERIYTFILISLLTFSILYYLMVYNVYQNSLQVFIEMNGLNYTFISLALNTIISILIGTFVALFNYKKKIMRKYGYAGTIGVIAGGFSGGCPTCGAFLFSLIGFPLALMSLPFKGLELKLLSILLLIMSVYFVSLSICTKCSVRKK